MREESYQAAFRRYERDRARYAELEEQIREFLARFTGNPKLSESDFAVRDLAMMLALRYERDQAYAAFHAAETAIFNRLGRPWD